MTLEELKQAYEDFGKKIAEFEEQGTSGDIKQGQEYWHINLFGEIQHEIWGNDEIDNSGSYIYCSSPKTQISGTTSKIVRVNNSLDYADIYKSSVRLYNSGKWVKPVQRVVSIDNALNDSIMANLLVFDYSYSNVFFSKQKQSNGWAQFYSQLFLAEENTTNYNATVLYDYYAMASLDSPLCQVVSITNYGVIDYPQMLVSSTTLSFDAEKGSLYTINTVPLLSITAAWAKISS